MYLNDSQKQLCNFIAKNGHYTIETFLKRHEGDSVVFNSDSNNPDDIVFYIEEGGSAYTIHVLNINLLKEELLNYISLQLFLENEKFIFKVGSKSLDYFHLTSPRNVQPNHRQLIVLLQSAFENEYYSTPLLGHFISNSYRTIYESFSDEETISRSKSDFWTRMIAIVSLLVSAASIFINLYTSTTVRHVTLVNSLQGQDTTKVLIVNPANTDTLKP